MGNKHSVAVVLETGETLSFIAEATPDADLVVTLPSTRIRTIVTSLLK